MESPSFGSREMCDGEILDELTTSRGELKVRSVSFREERHGQVTTIHFFLYLKLSLCLICFLLSFTYKSLLYLFHCLGIAGVS